MKQTYVVEIMGQRFSIKSHKTQAEVDRIVDYITEKMKKISKMKKTLSLHDNAILALLTVTDELFETRAEIGTYKEKIIHKTKKIIHMIDAGA